MNKWEWETCDCEFPEEIGCGCGNARCKIYRDRAVHWLDKHWRLECAFDHATMWLKKDDRGDKAIEMVRNERG